MYFNSNIKLLRNRKGRTQDEVAHALNMKRSTLSGYENNVAQPNMDALIALSKFFGIAIDTLIKIDLQKLSESQFSEIERGFDVYITGSNLRVLATTVNSENNENIEIVNEKAKAGYATGYSDIEYMKVLPVFQLPFLSKDRKYRTFQISGDSMIPIPDKSYVTAEYVQNWSYLKQGDACIIVTIEDGVVFKILANKVSEGKNVKLFSLNSFYKPFEINVKDIKEIWKFVNYISSVLPESLPAEHELYQTVANLQDDIKDIKEKILKKKK
ncbi:MAG: XRE family transcriptional regulator [Bacteroidota bacterium]